MNILLQKSALNQRGFTLAELLVTLSLIGILSLIVFSAISPFLEEAETAKNKRNAQTLAHVAAALTAGGDAILPTLANKSEVLAYLSLLAHEDQGDRAVGVPSLSEQELQAASPYLGYVHGFLSYVSDPVQED